MGLESTLPHDLDSGVRQVLTALSAAVKEQEQKIDRLENGMRNARNAIGNLEEQVRLIRRELK